MPQAGMFRHQDGALQVPQSDCTLDGVPLKPGNDPEDMLDFNSQRIVVVLLFGSTCFQSTGRKGGGRGLSLVLFPCQAVWGQSIPRPL